MRRITSLTLCIILFCIMGCYSEPHESKQPGYRYSSLDPSHKSDWAEIDSFLKVYNPENVLAFCYYKLKEYENHREDMAGWQEVTNCLEKQKSGISDCESRLDRISSNIDADWNPTGLGEGIGVYVIIDKHVATKTEILNKIAKAREVLSEMRTSIPTFENRMRVVKQDKENELMKRKNEIDKLVQSGNKELNYSEPDIKIELTDLFVDRELLSTSSISTSKADDCFVECNVKLKLTVTSENRIVRPRTGRISSSQSAYSSESNPNVIIVNPVLIQVPIGVEMEDNFGNHFGLIEINPLYEGDETSTGLRPGESQEFRMIFKDAPLKNTEELLITVRAGTFGNIKPFRLTIPKNIIDIALEEMP